MSAVSKPGFTRVALWVLVAGAMSVTLSLGIRAAFGIFLKPVSQDLGLGREVFSLALALATLITGFGGPIVGALADRYGAVRVAACGGALLALGLVLAAFVQGPLGLHIAFGVIIGMGMTAVGMGIIFGAVARKVPQERRTFAFGIVMSGGSLGQFLVIPFSQWLLASWDWRTACLVLAGFAALIVPIAWGLRDLGHDGKTPVGGMSFRDALREASGHSGFWLLTASFFVCGFHVNFINTHLPAYLSDRGMSGSVAATALALVGLFNIIGSLGVGWLGGRYRLRYLLAIVYISRSVIFLPLLLLPMTPALALGFSAAMGLLYLSSVAPTSALVTQIFGPRHFSMLYGFVMASHQVGGFLGSWLGGYIYDRTGSYDTVWWMAVALGVIAASLAAPIRDQPIARPAAA